MEKSENLGMQTFDGALFKLYQEGRVSFDDAMAFADSPNNLRLRIKLASEGEDKSVSASTLGELSLEAIEEEAEDEEENNRGQIM